MHYEIGDLVAYDEDSDIEDVPIEDDLYYTTLELDIVSCSGKNVHGDVVPIYNRRSGDCRYPLLVDGLDASGAPECVVAAVECHSLVYIDTMAETRGPRTQPRHVLKVGNANAFDFEDIVEYEYSIRAREVSSTGAWDELDVVTTFKIAVEDVNDVTIEGWEKLGDGSYSSRTPYLRSVLDTRGGEEGP